MIIKSTSSLKVKIPSLVVQDTLRPLQAEMTESISNHRPYSVRKCVPTDILGYETVQWAAWTYWTTWHNSKYFQEYFPLCNPIICVNQSEDNAIYLRTYRNGFCSEVTDKILFSAQKCGKIFWNKSKFFHYVLTQGFSIQWRTRFK